MLMRELRKTIKPLLWVIAISFLVSIFFTYGRFSGGGSGEKSLVKVNGTSILYASFLRSYRSAYNQYLQNTQGEISPQMENYLRSQVVSQLVSNEILYQEAKKAKIKVSKEEILRQIRGAMRNFASRENFIRWLTYQGYSYSDFEEEIERQIVISRLTQLIEDSAMVTDEEVKDHWAIENEKIKVEYLLLDPKKYAKDVKVTTEEAKKYYQDHKDDFKVPEKVKVQYILISPEEFKDKIDVSEQTLKKYYQGNLDEFEVEEERRASHILIRLSSSATEEEEKKAKEKIEEIERKIKEGANFNNLAKEYSEDPASAIKGGDLGFFTYQTMTPSFSKAVFSLEEIGEVSPMVKTSFGYHLIKLIGIQPSYTVSFEEVKEEINNKVIEQESEKEAHREIEEIKERINERKISFEEYAKEYPDRVKITPLFSRYEEIEGFGWDYQFVQTAFSLKLGEVSSSTKIPEGYCLINLLEKEPSHVLSWDEVKEEAEEKLAENKAEKITQQRAIQLVEKLREGSDLSSLVEEWEYQELDYFTRQDLIKQMMDQDSEQFIKVVFSLGKEEISNPLLLTQGYYIIKLLDRELPSYELNEGRDDFEEKILSRKRQDLLSAWFEEVREKAKIVDNTSLFFSS
ncbi:peptidylprolyl isomerase [Patescibacteria group bacterium]|nr:peptidylprolyl isomerase [Patescibacteria group bacterium]